MIAGLHRQWLLFPLCSRCFRCQRDVLLQFLECVKKIQLYQLLIIKRVRFYLTCEYSLIGFNVFICFTLRFPKDLFCGGELSKVPFGAWPNGRQESPWANKLTCSSPAKWGGAEKRPTAVLGCILPTGKYIPPTKRWPWSNRRRSAARFSPDQTGFGNLSQGRESEHEIRGSHGQGEAQEEVSVIKRTC